MRKSKIRFEWDFERPGLLLATRDSGMITMPELLDALRDSFPGYFFAMAFIVHDDEPQFDGRDHDEGAQRGETWELWQVEDGEPCPICGRREKD